jgi:ribosomal protein S11
VFWAWNGTLALFSAADVWSQPAPAQLAAERAAPERVDLGQPFPVRLTVRVRGGAKQPRSACLAGMVVHTGAAPQGRLCEKHGA